MDVSSIDIISCLLIAYTISTFSYTTKFKMTDSFSSIVCRTNHNNPETLLVSMWELRPPTHLWLSPRSASWWIPRWSWSLYLFRFCSHTSLQCTARPAPPTTACQYHCTGVSLCDQNLLPSGSGLACFCLDLANFTHFFSFVAILFTKQPRKLHSETPMNTTYCSCSQMKTVRFSRV